MRGRFPVFLFDLMTGEAECEDDVEGLWEWWELEAESVKTVALFDSDGNELAITKANAFEVLGEDWERFISLLLSSSTLRTVKADLSGLERQALVTRAATYLLSLHYDKA